MADFATNRAILQTAVPIRTVPSIRQCAEPTVDVWVLSLVDLEGSLRFHPFLDPSEKALVSVSPHRVAVRLALRIILGHYVESHPAKLRFGLGAYGKPELVDAQVSFNVTHRKGMALIAIAPKGRVGIDLENQQPLADIDGIVRMLHPDERAHLKASPEGDRMQCFYRIWTRKEAALKAIGIGLFRGLDAFSVVSESPYNRVRTATLTDGPPLALHDVVVGTSWIASLATEIGITRPSLRAFSATDIPSCD